MIEVKSSPFSSHRLEIDDPLLLAFITGNAACALLTRLEKEQDIRFRFDSNCIIVEGRGRINLDVIKTTLMEAWKENDFKRAIEVSELTNSSDFQLYFKVSPAEAALMEVNTEKLLRCPDLMAFKVDAFGNVCLFGKNASAAEVFEMVSEVVCSAATVEKPDSGVSYGGPCVLSMRLPHKLAASVFSSENSTIAELQRAFPFFVENKTTSLAEGETGATVSIDVFTKNFEDAMKVKELIGTQLDSMCSGKRKSIGEVKLKCGMHTISFPMGIGASTRDCKAVLSADVIQLIFWASERDAPRIIGSHGITKKRIQECSKCTVLLHTESKHNGFFPVEIIGPNVQKCVETRNRIQSFLMQTPPVAVPKEQQWTYPFIDDRTCNGQIYKLSLAIR